MSNQSGISASAELQEHFKNFLASTDRALILEIENETCIPGPIVSGDGSQSFEQVAQHLSENEPRYVVYRQQKPDLDDSYLLFISYVPDHAPVRNKMLYASSTNTVFKQLGGGQTFDHSIFWTELSEFSASGWNAHLDHINASAPMTEEEQSLQDVTQSEADQVLGSRKSNLHRMHLPNVSLSGSSSPVSTSGSGISLGLHDDIHQALDTLAQADRGAISLHVDVSNEQVVLGQHHETASETSLGQIISDSQPQYTVYKHNSDSVLFIYTCPNGSKVRERMLYASNKESAVSAISKKLIVSKVIEAIDATDVTADQLTDHLESLTISPSPVKPVKKSFAKPKRPGRS